MSYHYVENTAGKPIKMWADPSEVEPQALEQLKQSASLPFVFKHVAAMPDIHSGRGSTIGSVIATRKAICPCCVGVDIGCGMQAARLDIDPGLVLDNLPKLRASIERSIPVGDSSNRGLTPEVEGWMGWENWESTALGKIDKKGDYLSRAKHQLGSLGGGNHFVEVCVDKDGKTWIMLHSGSRGIGNSLATHHINHAKRLMEAYFINLPHEDLSYFTEAMPEFHAYMYDLLWAQQYAFANRAEMMRRCLKDISHHVGLAGAPVPTSFEVSCHHNYVSLEHHFGENVYVTRKGAVRARDGEMGIIPGSMGTKSYIVRGKGNVDSFHSCSHGAGRRMSRNAARAKFTVQDLIDQTSGVECRKDNAVVDEIPGAYKDIDKVMAAQTDLVEIVAELKQVLCVKG